MSMLYMFCNKRQVVTVGDFRRYLMSNELPSTDQDGNFNFAAVQKFQDDSPKLHFISSKLLAGYVGHMLPELDELIASFIEKSSSFEQAVELTKDLINNNKDLKNFKSAIILGGVMENGDAAIFSARTDTGEFDLQLGSERFCYTGTSASYDPSAWITEQLKDHDYSLGKLLYVAQKLGELLAANDRLVSPKISLFAIGG